MICTALIIENNYSMRCYVVLSHRQQLKELVLKPQFRLCCVYDGSK